MNRTIKIREAARNFIIPNSRWLKIIGKGALAFVSFLIINYYFGYISFLANPIFALIMAVGCAFIPMRAGGLLVMVYVFVQLTGLSGQVAIVALILLLISYGLSMFYGSGHMFNIDYIPIALQVQLPYPIVVVSALFGKINYVTSVICGGVLSFYLKVIRENSLIFIEETQDITVIDLISKRMIVNPMLYVYLIAITALFVIIVLVKDVNIRHAWIVAIASGIFVEMVIMLLGYIITGNISKVPMLIIANVLAFAIGVASTYVYRDLDYERVEKVQFEDDDYLYFVTAIPKIELAKEEKRITRFTDIGKGFHKAGKIEEEKPKETEDKKEKPDDGET
ncbi:MAG: hypothetical protein K5644_06625 [Lachnospiraceae bacterium]|nr:hypothetical protein [Lachnospiraceae bacterium]